jgi:hypothetical protein
MGQGIVKRSEKERQYGVFIDDTEESLTNGSRQEGDPCLNLSYYFNQLVIFCEDDMQPFFLRRPQTYLRT